MKERSIGMAELSSVAAGYLAADTMLKAGNVHLLLSRTICSGKFAVIVRGDVQHQRAARHGRQANLFGHHDRHPVPGGRVGLVPAMLRPHLGPFAVIEVDSLATPGGRPLESPGAGAVGAERAESVDCVGDLGRERSSRGPGLETSKTRETQ